LTDWNVSVVSIDAKSYLNYDFFVFKTKTKADRAALDKLVQEALTATLTGRADLAMRLVGFKNIHSAGRQQALRAISESLKRGVRDGWAVREGDAPWCRYRSAP